MLNRNKSLETKKKNKQLKIFETFKSFFSREKNDFVVGENMHEEIFQSFERKNRNRKLLKKIAGIVFIFLMIGVTGFVVYSRIKNANVAEESVKVEIPQNQDHVFVNDVSGVMSEAKENDSMPVDGLAGVSENYRIKDISIGGSNVVLVGDDENSPLNVSDVRSETLMSKDGKEIKMLVSWKTNKLAKSEVRYSKNGQGDEKSFKEDGYGFSHALVMNKLDSATRYLFTVKVNDRAGNTNVSEQLAVFTGSKPVSVFELIASQFGDIFGWAMKK